MKRFAVLAFVAMLAIVLSTGGTWATPRSTHTPALTQEFDVLDSSPPYPTLTGDDSTLPALGVAGTQRLTVYEPDTDYITVWLPMTPIIPQCPLTAFCAWATVQYRYIGGEVVTVLLQWNRLDTAAWPWREAGESVDVSTQPGKLILHMP